MVTMTTMMKKRRLAKGRTMAPLRSSNPPCHSSNRPAGSATAASGSQTAPRLLLEGMATNINIGASAMSSQQVPQDLDRPHLLTQLPQTRSTLPWPACSSSLACQACLDPHQACLPSLP
jgi:hypothetical protein